MGPLGRLEHLVDGQVAHYQPQYGGATGVTPAKIEVEQRDAFVSLPSTSRSVSDGTPSSPPWSPVEALGSVGAQLVSICDAQPRVWTGTDYRTYPGVRVLTNQLAQDVFHTSQTTKQATDDAYLSGVTCSVWTESTTISTGTVTTSFVGIKADSGAWLVTPTVLNASTVGVTTSAKVVQDGSHFFVFYNVGAVIHINVYDTHGALLGVTSGGTLIGLHGPVWDITAAVTASPAGTVLFAQCLSTVADSGVAFSSVGWNGSAVTVSSAIDNTIRGAGPLAFLTNDTGNGLTYIATLDSVGQVYAYKIASLAQAHQFGPIYTLATDKYSLDSITGYATQTTGLSVVVSIGLLPALGSPPASGPPVDPALRFLVSLACDSANDVVTLRTTQSLCQVSRAFAIDGEYYVYAYYQSGSGIGLLPQTQSVTITTGDYMIGAATQPIAISPGDHTFGSPINTTSLSVGGSTVFTSAPITTRSIAASDFVSQVQAPAWMASLGIPTNSTILLWNFANLSAGTANFCGGQLVVTGSSMSLANSTWDVIALSNTSGNQFYTSLTDINGTPGPVSGTFTHTGSFVVNSMTAYQIPDQSASIESDAAFFFTSGGTIAVTGTDAGTFNIVRLYLGQGPTWGLASLSLTPPSSAVWVATVSQTTSNGSFTAVLTPQNANRWVFFAEKFDSTYVGTNLVVTANPALPANVGTYPVTAAPVPSVLTVSGTPPNLPQIFTIPYPTAAIVLTTQVPYTFHLQSLTLDYTFQGALVSVQGADAANNGTYQIVQIIDGQTFIATPTNGLTNQVNEALTNAVTITIFFAQNIQPEFQPTWFIVPIAGSQPVVGRFEYGLAYADWRIEIDNTRGPNLFPMSVASVMSTPIGSQIVLPYRAQNVTAATLETTAAGEVNIVEESFVSTVGLKVFTLGNTFGTPRAGNGELSIPGPMAVVFTPSGFIEDGQNLAPEAPFLVSQSVAAGGQIALTLAGVYFVVVVLEYTDENGNRTYSPPSPALQVNMSGTNNVATYGGRLPYPISSTGGPVANTYGPTTRLSGISLYRTAFLNGEPTTQHYKITDDLSVNGLAPLTTLNPSGFSFPDTFTWNYVDQNPDAGLNSNEILYTDKSLLPRYPQPAGPRGPVTWKNREWAIGYDDAVWMSGEKAEGDAIWYNPAFRFPFPAEDAPLGLAGMDDYLIVVCEASVWYIPAAQFPDATGSNGGLPTPVRLPFPNGSRNGFCETIREGVAYDSTDGGVWLVTRQLQNQWLSHDLLTTLTGEVVGMAVDQGQRLGVLQKNSRTLCVYDGIPQCWYEWNMPTQGIVLASFNGQLVYQDTNVVVPVVPGTTADTVNGATTGIAGPDVTLADLIFGNIRGLKKVWEFQAVGTYKGPHNANAVLSYPEDGWPTRNYAITPISTNPYVLPFNPNPEDASTYKVRIYPDFSGVVSPGATFSLEMLSAQVGVEPIGISKLPSYLVMKQK